MHQNALVHSIGKKGYVIYKKKRNRLINRNILNFHAKIFFPPDWWMQPMNKAMATHMKQVIKRIQQRNRDIDILPLPSHPFSNNPFDSVSIVRYRMRLYCIHYSGLICTVKFSYFWTEQRFCQFISGKWYVLILFLWWKKLTNLRWL